MIQAKTPKGFRDFLPQEAYRRNYLKDLLQKHFERFGFLPIETPVMENLSTLTGKYGEEGDRLLFKVLNSGQYLKSVSGSDWTEDKLTPAICQKGMRYDLTVPLARYAVQHQNELAFPFKRYHIAPVWRADRPQKGRYREFYQCDIDVLGNPSLFCEIELLQLYAYVFSALGLKVKLNINHRALLLATIERLGFTKEQAPKALTTLDKLDKIGPDKVHQLLLDLGLENEDLLHEMLANPNTLPTPWNEESEKGINDLTFIMEETLGNGLPNGVLIEFQSTLARGLDYYTGMICEVTLDEEVSMGSLGGGGRYDNLTEIFGKKDVTGVGVSFGFERIYDVLTELNRWPEINTTGLDLLILPLDKKAAKASFPLLTELRLAGLQADMYTDDAKMKKMMKYADKRGVPFVLVIGDRELSEGLYPIKNMRTGEQRKVTKDLILEHIKATA